ncbi:efflux RND transporter periplasmic adaptor subunit [Lewinella sp. W8]|uniref:efflux RND transporter periplasmic adaptor subunit n=1 Tax=Lewinella sp. W8 TaxID=2528208 RepID=UPI0015646871|nr:efflux RND transporter periplasmic adaptor subunit [Lewinella sp. W8]
MKRLPILGFALLLIMASCGRAEEEEQLPAGLAEKQELLREKRAELRKLTQEIEALEDTIAVLDPSFAPNATLVTYETLNPQSFENYTNVQATVRANETAMASAEIPGRIIRLTVDDGDLVRKGQLIAVLNVEDIETQREEVEKATELAKTVFERQERLWNQQIGSEIQYLQAKNNYERLQKQLAAIDVQSNKRNVYAPISGTVERVMLRAGENAMPGAPIASILSTNDLKVIADAPEELLAKVERGQQVKVIVPALDLDFEARVVRIGRTVDPANRTFEVEVDVPGRYLAQLKTNLLAEIEVLDFAAEDLLVVSQDLIQQEVDGRRYVFIANEKGGKTMASKVFIKTGATYNNMAVITEGLTAGDRIITTGARGLVDEQLITLSQNPITNGQPGK